MMNIHDINKLLNKYWDAETTLDEEQILIDYFNSNDVAEEHMEYRPLFQFYASASNVKLDKIKELRPEKAKVISFRKYSAWGVIGIAASFIILVAVGVINFTPQPTTYGNQFTLESIEVTEEAEALAITKDALAYLGVKWDNSSQIIKTNVAKMETVSILK